MKRKSDAQIRQKIENYQARLLQRFYEGNLHALIESFYAIWFLSWTIGEIMPQPEILKGISHRYVPLDDYIQTVRHNEGMN